tara:strand:+ start:505 stop:1008 length:504 start_codon:yes stop_codon:yes gene_type:complete
MKDQSIFDEDLDRSLGFLLNDVARLMRTRFDRQARDLGLTRAQWRVMMYLRRHEGARQNELAGLLEVENVTLGRHIDRLEESGWVERRADPSDRRAWRLHLDEKSRPILDRLAVVLIETRETALSGFNADERGSLIKTLIRMKYNLVDGDAIGAEDVPRPTVGAADL